MRPITAIATFGQLTELESKMAHGILRYCENVVVIIDEKNHGKNSNELLPYIGRVVPIVKNLAESLSYGVKELVIGSSPPGGGLTESMFDMVEDALELGIRVVHGMHNTIVNHPRLESHTDNIVELRHIGEYVDVAKGDAAELNKAVVLLVGSDCACGKMTTALDLTKSVKKLGVDARFIATGQTGIYIAGDGLPVDAIKSDFVAGAVEKTVMENKHHSCLIIEGQGSLFHPAYSGVSLSLMHGASPNIIIFAHDLSRPAMAYYEKTKIDVKKQIEAVELMASIRRPASVLAVAAMARGLSADAARQEAEKLARNIGLPVFVINDGLDELAKHIVNYGKLNNLF